MTFERGSKEDLWDKKCFDHVEEMLGDDGIDRFSNYLNEAWERDIRRYEKRKRKSSNRWAAVIGLPLGVIAGLIVGGMLGL
jgi:hypothetical protein